MPRAIQSILETGGSLRATRTKKRRKKIPKWNQSDWYQWGPSPTPRKKLVQVTLLRQSARIWKLDGGSRTARCSHLSTFFPKFLRNLTKARPAPKQIGTLANWSQCAANRICIFWWPTFLKIDVPPVDCQAFPSGSSENNYCITCTGARAG